MNLIKLPQSSVHEMRNLLILACTEVEAQFRGVLTKNNYPSTSNWNIKNFHVLKDILKLEDYAIKLAYFPEAGLIKPFQGWQLTGPLSWYKSYNAVKHEREENFDQATLVATIEAVCAIICAIWR